MLLFTAVLTRRTALGMLIEAVGINPEASRLAGVRARTIIWTVYAFSGLCAGLAGLVIAANTNSVNANSLGLWIELDAILAVVIGGTSLMGGRFSLAGTFVGALFIATLARTIPNIGIPSEINYLFKAVVVIAVCLLQSSKARAPAARAPTGSSHDPPREGRSLGMSTVTVPTTSPWDRVKGYRLRRATSRSSRPSPCSSDCSASAACATTASPTRRCCSACSSTTPS